MNKRRKSSSANNSRSSNLLKCEIEDRKVVKSDSSKNQLSNISLIKQPTQNAEDKFVISLYNDMVEITLTKQFEANVSGILNNEINDTKIESDESIKIDEELFKPDDNKFAEFHFPNKNIYVGKINCNQQINGDGKYRWACGENYEGKFNKNTIEGKGRMEWKDGSWYDGEFRKNYRHATGNFNSHDNERFYIGNWFMGRKHGQGYCRYDKKLEDFYVGEWKMNKKHGKGNRVYKNGTRYIGEWKNDLKDGNGIIIWKNGDLYRGEWKNGMMNGYGEYVWKGSLNESLSWPKENSYAGGWLNRKRHGNGVLKLNSTGGAIYSGNWYLDKKHERGMIIGNSGAVTKGDPLFLNNTLVPVDKELEELENLSLKEGEKSLIQQEKPREITVFEPPHFPPLSHHVKRLLKTEKYELEFSTPNGIKLSNKKCGIYKSESECCCISYDSLLTENPEQILKSTSSLQLKPSGDSLEFFNNNEKNRYEEHWVHNCLITHMKSLRKIYKLYAQLYCKNKSVEESANLSMGRIAFWQLMRDCNIHKKESGISLVEYQRYFEIARNESSNFMESEFNPFGRIEFYQFIDALLELSWHLYTKLGDFETVLMRGKLAGGLHRFLLKDVFPNAGKFVGNLSKKFLDLLPIDSVYKLYRSVGEPHSAKEFLRATCASKTSELFALRQLGAKKIVSIISDICPGVKDEESGSITNMDYELTFLEFYEILLEATRLLIYEQKLFLR